MRAVHLIEGWWEGVRNESATDAAAFCCAAWMRQRPLDLAIALGPAPAVERLRAAGVPIARSWSAPLGLHGLSQRSIRRVVADLAAHAPFAGAVVWTPGAMAAAVGLDLPLTDMTSGSRWDQAEALLSDRSRARSALCAGLGFDPDAVFLVGAPADPPGRCDAFLAMYGIALADGAGLFERRGRRGVLVVPQGAGDSDRARGFVAGLGKPAELAEVRATPMELICGVDAAMMMPTAPLPSPLAHARVWWMRVARARGIPTIVGPGEEGTVSLPAWGRSELGKAMAMLLSKIPEEATR
ncbi:MAG: hypothetical protein HEQ23_13425 [Tepidisphaera sp.]